MLSITNETTRPVTDFCIVQLFKVDNFLQLSRNFTFFKLPIKHCEEIEIEIFKNIIKKCISESEKIKINNKIKTK